MPVPFPIGTKVRVLDTPTTHKPLVGRIGEVRNVAFTEDVKKSSLLFTVRMENGAIEWFGEHELERTEEA